MGKIRIGNKQKESCPVVKNAGSILQPIQVKSAIQSVAPVEVVRYVEVPVEKIEYRDVIKEVIVEKLIVDQDLMVDQVARVDEAIRLLTLSIETKMAEIQVKDPEPLYIPTIISSFDDSELNKRVSKLEHSLKISRYVIGVLALAVVLVGVL